LYNKKYGIPFS
jgi:glycerol-3-phosphate dehydrogenase